MRFVDGLEQNTLLHFLVFNLRTTAWLAQPCPSGFKTLSILTSFNTSDRETYGYQAMFTKMDTTYQSFGANGIEGSTLCFIEAV